MEEARWRTHSREPSPWSPAPAAASARRPRGRWPRQGAKVAVAARRLERLERLAAEIGGGGHTALAIESDITDQEQAIDAVERTVDELGRLDIVVNNAGQMLLGPIEDAPTEEWDRMIDLNLKGLINTTHAALPHLLARRRGLASAAAPTWSTSAPSPAASPAPAPASTT